MGVSTDHTHDAHTGPTSQGDLQSGMVAGQRRLKDKVGGSLQVLSTPPPQQRVSLDRHRSALYALGQDTF